MKKIILAVAICISFLQITYAQDTTSIYKKFRVDLMFGGAFKVPVYSQGQDYAGIFSIEPRYNFNDHFSLGLRYVFSQTLNAPDREHDVTTNSHSFLANATYTATLSRTIRVYAGAGAGISNSGQKDSTMSFSSGKLVNQKTNVAFMPRVGLQIWRITTEVFYNCTGDDNTNFAGMAFGFYFGGGKRNK